MVSQSAEYGLRAVVCLAARPGQPLTVHQIAAVTGVPGGYLSKILQLLAKSGMVVSQRGFNGGFVLARDPSTLTLLEVARVIDPSRRIHCCPLGLPSHSAGLCPLHHRIDEAARVSDEVLQTVTVTQVLGESNAATPLCDGTLLIVPPTVPAAAQEGKAV